MAFKVVVSQKAETHQIEVDEAKALNGLVIGDEFDGVISSVASFGFFVELDNTVEGFVRAADLKDDYYVYNEKDLTLTGERTKKVYRIGDSVRVKVAGVNTALHEIDFILAEN